jgi:hypothetical protein
MSERLQFTPPVFSPAQCIQFSVFGVDSGYRSFALSADTVRRQLGARDESRDQLLLAFNLNKPRIARAIEHLSPCENGHPRIIGPGDL